MTNSGWRLTLSNGCIQQRYVLSIMGFLAIVVAYTMRVSLSVAIVAMVGTNHSGAPYDPYACDYPQGNSTIIEGEFDWDEQTVGLILGAFYWGYLITHMPGGILSERWGGKYLLGIGIFSTAIFTLLSPAAARAGPGYFIAIRVLMGLGEGTTFPALNALLAQWIPISERGFLGTLVFSGSQIGTVVGTALSGVLIEWKDWEFVFYFFGGCTIIWFVVFCLICYSKPSEHPFISQDELDFLNQEIGSIVDTKIPPIPWRQLLTSIPLWGLVCAQVGHDWGFYTLVTDLPLYMSDVLHFSISTNGFVSSLPYLVMWVVSMASGWYADRLIRQEKMTVTNVRKVFTTIASAVPATGMVIASHAGCNKYVVVALFTIFVGTMGTFYPGMKVNALDLSPNYAGTLMAIVNGIGSITGIVTPYIVGTLVQDHTAAEWRNVFWIVLEVMMVTNLIFVLTASGEVQPWNWGADPSKSPAYLRTQQALELKKAEENRKEEERREEETKEKSEKY